MKNLQGYFAKLTRRVLKILTMFEVLHLFLCREVFWVFSFHERPSLGVVGHILQLREQNSLGILTGIKELR